MTTDSTTPDDGSTDRPTALADHVIDLRGTTPDGSHEDLAALREHLADARVVGLGEATHGTREFFELKSRIVRYLVTELDVRAVALEANFSEAMALHDYVVHGDGDPVEALDAVYFWTWSVDSVRSLLTWLREFNEGRPLDDRVRFYGVDAQYTAGPVDALLDFFETVDPAFLDGVRTDLRAAHDDGSPPHRDDDRAAIVAAADRVAAQVRTRLDERDAAYRRKTDRATVDHARQHARALAQAADYRRHFPDDPDDPADHEYARVRDGAMADNVDWILDRPGVDCVPVWAHGDHLARTTRTGDVDAPSTGSFLADRYGSDYYAVGFAFGSGAFRAVHAGPSADDGGLTEFAVDGPLAGTVEETLAGLDATTAVLDLRAAREDERLADWLAALDHRSIGATYDPTAPRDYVVTYDYTAAFDALCWVAETTSARPIGA